MNSSSKFVYKGQKKMDESLSVSIAEDQSDLQTNDRLANLSNTMAVVLGETPGVIPLFIGAYSNVETSEHIVQSGPDADQITDFSFGISESISFSSSSINDVVGAGSGMRLIRIFAIKSDFTEGEYILPLGGQLATIIPDDILYINSASVLDAGSSKCNEGGIYFYPDGSPTTNGIPDNISDTRKIIEIGVGSLRSASYMTSASTLLQIDNIVPNVESGKVVFLDIEAITRSPLIPNNPIKTKVITLSLDQGLRRFNSNHSYAFGPGTLMKFSSHTNIGFATVFLAVEGKLIDVALYPNFIPFR